MTSSETEGPYVEVVVMLLVGESINGTRKQVGEAIQARDAEFIKGLATDQVAAGANILDVNGGVAGGNEVDDLLWLIATVRSVTDTQLMVDSASPAALQAGVEAAIKDGGKVPYINSISGEQSRIDTVLPLVEKYKCPVVALCLNDEGIPPTADDRFAVAKMLHDKLAAAGLPAEDMWFDPLVMTVSADSTAALVTMQTLALIKANLPGVRSTGGLSNVSFGLPNRPLLNRTFVAMCAGIGIDGAVLDVRNKQMMATIKAIEALRNEDTFCGNYLKAHRAGLLE
jgi:cobalamin-dependent methionine synthase I